MRTSYTLIKGDEVHVFNSEKEACDFLNVRHSNVASAYMKHHKIRGYSAIRGKPTSHFESHTRIYRIWASMKDRCNRKKNDNYHNYGGRGIKVCKEWNEYETFRDWALGNGYSDDLTLDRIDVNGNYEPSNCRWVTMKVQCANKRENRFVVVNGEKMIAKECSRKYGIPKSTVLYRLNHGNDVLTGKSIDKE